VSSSVDPATNDRRGQSHRAIPQADGVVARLADTFYRDVRLMGLVITLIGVAGVSSFAIMPRMEDPMLLQRVAMINTRLPGADATRVESLITEKIEDQLRDIEEVKELRSVSRAGISTVSIELLDEIDETDAVWSRVRSRVEDSIAELPPEASRPRFEELRARAYALIVGIVWDRSAPADLRLLRRLAKQLQDELQMIPGTETVDRFGDPGEVILVTIDPKRAASMGVTPADVATRVQGYDAKQTAGQLRSQSLEMLIEVGNQLDAVEQLAAIPVAKSGGRDVRLGDVARVRLQVPDPLPRAALVDGREAVVLGVMVRPASRIDFWTERAEQVLTAFERTAPEGIRTDVVLRQSDYVDQRLRSLTWNLLAGATAVSTLICFLMGWRSAILVTLTLPLASLMVLFGLRSQDIPIHQMSITGLIIALGLLIDNAIVIVDEVRSRLRAGVRPEAAMVASVSHLAGPLFGSTLTTALAFAPIALMPGPSGEFVGSIAISVILAIFSSLVLALTVIPSLAARLLSRESDRGHRQPNPVGGKTRSGLIMQWCGWTDGLTLPRVAVLYRGVIRQCVRRPWVGISAALVLPIAGFLSAPFLEEQFFPPSGRNQFHMTIERPPTSTIAQTRKTAALVDRIAREMGAERIDWFFGESAPQFYYNVIASRRGTDNYAQGLVTLPAASDPGQLIAALQRQLDEKILSSRVLVRQLEQGPPFQAPVEVRLYGPDLEVLRGLGHEVRRMLSAMPEVVAVQTDLNEVLPQLSVDVNETAAVQAGVTPQEVARQLNTALEGSTGGSVLQDNEQIPVLVRVGEPDRASWARVRSMDLVLPPALPGETEKASADNNRGANMRVTPVSAFASFSLRPEAAAIPRRDRRRVNEVGAFIRAGVLPSVVQGKIETLLSAEQFSLPQGVTLEYGGEASKRDSAIGNLFSTVGVLVVLMAATLVLSFGSFRMAALIALVAALAIGLGLGALQVGGYPFGFMAIIGTMGLIGVAINDSIVVLASIRANPFAVKGDVEATVDEVMHATRHVVATTLTTMAGFTPLILDGGAFWPPMAVAIAGGVSGATLLALVLVPSLHRWLVRPAAIST